MMENTLDSFAVSMMKTQALETVRELRKCNELSERYGLSLSEAQMQTLAMARAASLKFTGRMELGEGVLPRLIYAFCDSPYIQRSDYCETLSQLQELFYTFHNETYDTFSDDELIDAMQKLFNGKAQGSLEYLENATAGDLYHALNGSEEDNGGFESGEDD